MATENGEVEGHHPLDSTRSPKQDNYTSTTSELRKRPLPASDDAQFRIDSNDQRELTTAERFEQFHAENPAVYRVLCRLAREWIARTGRHQLAIATLVERARWEILLATNDPDYKINNNFRSYYARLLMAQEPDLADLFELRRSIADEWIGRAA